MQKKSDTAEDLKEYREVLNRLLNLKILLAGFLDKQQLEIEQ